MRRLVMIAVGSTLALGLGWGLLSPSEPSEGHAGASRLEGAARESWWMPAALRGQDGSEALDAAVLRLRSSAGGDMTFILAQLLALAETDPEWAVRLAAALTDAEGREHALHECLPHWLHDDPEAAHRWLMEEALPLPYGLIGALARDTAAVDPRLALKLADRLPVGERASPMGEVFSAWAAKDPAEAARVAESLPTQRDRAAAFEAVGRLWAEGDAQAAFEWAAGQELPASRRVALESVVGAWAHREPEAAARSVAVLPKGEVFRQRLLDQVAGGWAEADLPAALDWADALEAPEEREATATTILLQQVSSAPERAADEAFRISDGKMSPLVDKVVVAWSAKDKTGAESWIRGHGLALGAP